jgi:hypothetical protein
MAIAEHTGMSVEELTYEIKSVELFSYWSAIIKKVEDQNKQIEEQKTKQ